MRKMHYKVYRLTDVSACLYLYVCLLVSMNLHSKVLVPGAWVRKTWIFNILCPFTGPGLRKATRSFVPRPHWQESLLNIDCFQETYLSLGLANINGDSSSTHWKFLSPAIFHSIKEKPTEMSFKNHSISSLSIRHVAFCQIFFFILSGERYPILLILKMIQCLYSEIFSVSTI